MLVGRILHNKGYFDDYVQFADELKNLPAALVSVGKASDEKARAYAMKYKTTHIRSGLDQATCGAPPIPLPCACWKSPSGSAQKSVTSPEFFHGTIELVEKGVCVALNMTEGQTRGLDERVKNFVQAYTDDFTVFDTADYQLPGISTKVQMAALAGGD